MDIDMKTIAAIILGMLTFGVYGQTPIKTEIDTTFDTNGKIESVTYKTNGKKDKIVNYYEGNIYTEFNLKNGVRDGISITYNYKKKGKIQSKAMYKDGRLNGLFENYNDTGKVISTGNYENGSISGPYIRFYSNGNKNSVSNYKDGKLDGLTTMYYKNGKVKDEVSYKEGKKDGQFAYYYENGNKQYTGAYKDDKMFGERLCYDENGKLITGNFISYTDDGLVDRECKCINGKPEGQLKQYSGGQVYFTIDFKNGKPDGFLIYRSGKTKELYKDGVFVKEIKEETK